VAAVNLWLSDDWLRLGRTNSGGGQERMDISAVKDKTRSESRCKKHEYKE